MNTPTSVTRIDWSAGNYYTHPHWNAAGDTVAFLRTTTSGTAAMQVPITGGAPGAISEIGVANCSGPDW
jgi:Tol biopolymer transport system component